MSVNGFAGPRRTGQLIDRRAESTPDQRARCVALFQQKVGAPVGKITRRRSVYPDQGYCGAINLNNLKPVHHGYATVISLWHLVCRITIDAGQLFLPTNAAPNCYSPMAAPAMRKATGPSQREQTKPAANGVRPCL